MRNRLLLIGLCMVLLAMPGFALEFDNIGEYDSENQEYSIVNLWGYGDTFAKVKMLDHSEQCIILSDCYLEVEVTIIDSTSDDLNNKANFIDEFGRDHGYLYNLFIEKDVTIEQIAYTTEGECEYANDFSPNGTSEPDCSGIREIRHVNERVEKQFVPYDGSRLDEGTYKFRFKGNHGKNIGVDIVPNFFGVEATEWVWWDTDWIKKKKLTITNNAPVTVDDLTINFTVPHTSKMNSTFQDLRFLNSSETGELNYWIESYTADTEAHVWVLLEEELPASSTLEIYMYYNNSNVVNSSSKPDVFIVYDNFDDNSIDGAKWSSSADAGLTIAETGSEIKVSGTATGSVNGGSLDIASQSHAKLKSVAKMGLYSEIVGDIRLASGSTERTAAEIGYRNTTAIASATGLRFSIGPANWSGPDVDTLSIYSKNGASINNVFGSAATNDQTYHTYRLIRNSTHATGYLDGVLMSYLTWDSDNELEGRHVEIIGMPRCGTPVVACSGTDDTIDARFDNLQARNYLQNIPSIAFGPERDVLGIFAEITKESPADAVTLNGLNNVLSCNATTIGSTDYIKNVTHFIYDNNDVEIHQNTIEYTGFNESVIANYTFNISGGYHGNETFLWNCFLCLNNSECNYNVNNITGGDSNRSFFVDNIEPNINIINPTIEGLISTIKLKFGVVEGGTLQTCWYSIDDGANTTHVCATNDTTISIASYGVHNITLYANDTMGNTNSTRREFVVIEKLQDIFESNVLEGDTAPIDIVIEDPSSISPTMVLIHNNTEYNSTLINAVADNKTYRATVDIPDIDVDVAAMEFNWTIIGTIAGNTGNGSYATNFHNVTFIQLDNCSNYSHLILNLSLFDEDTKLNSSLENATIETDISAQTRDNPDIEWNFNTSIQGTNLQVCINDQSIVDREFSLDTITRYFAKDHVVEYHYIQDGNLTNNSLFNANLYVLDELESTSFLMVYKDDFFLPVEGAIIDTLRLYVGEGQFISIEHGKTNDQGETALHLVTEEVTYKFIVSKNGEILYISPEYLALCQTAPCQINLEAEENIADHINYSQIDGVSFSLDKNYTDRSVSLLFTSVDGSSVDMALNVTMWNSYLNETACYTTVSASSGTLDCTIPATFENTSYYVQIYKDEKEIGTSSFSIAPKGNDAFGPTGIALTIFMVVTLVFMAITTGSGIIVLFWLVLGLVVASALFLYSGGGIFGVGATFIWLISAIVIVMWKMARRRFA